MSGTQTCGAACGDAARIGGERARVSPGGASALALSELLALSGCSDRGDPVTVAQQTEPAANVELPSGDGAAIGDAVPSRDETSSDPNFTFTVSDAVRTDPTTSPTFVARLEAFFEGSLAPLQRLPGLMPRTVSIVYDRCGQVNAFHDRATDTITLCHEFTEYAYAQYAADPGTGSNDPEEEASALTQQAFYGVGFILYHEIAHAMDFQRDLPIAGNVESAMDAIATVIAVETGQPLYPLGGGLLLAGQPNTFLGVHGGGEDRRGDILCWTVGGSAASEALLDDPTIGPVLDFDAAGRDCTTEYEGQRSAVRGWVPGLARLDAAPSGLGGGDGESAFRLGFGPGWLQGVGADPAERDRVSRLFAESFEPLDAAVAGLPGEFDVVYEACEASEAFYDARARTMTLCEGLVEDAYGILIAPYDDPDTGTRALVLERAYDTLRFALYHEFGHALDALGRLPADEDVDRSADALATVLLVEAGRGTDAFLWGGVHIQDESVDDQDDAVERAIQVVCLALGGDAALRADPSVPEFLIDTYITGDLDCIEVYDARREEVRSWLSEAASS